MTTIQLRRGSSDDWAKANPVLAPGEPGYDLDADVLKIGDGTSTWAELPGYLTGDVLSDMYVRADAPQAWTPTQKLQALDNIDAGRIRTPRQWGTTGGSDDTATFQTAVDDLHANGGGTLWCDEDKYAIGGLIMRSNVVLRSLGQRTTLYPPSDYSGWIIDTPPGPVKQMNIGIRDLLINGNVTGPSSLDIGGIRFQLTSACQVSNVGVAQTSYGCFKQLAGQATQLISCGFQNHYEYRTLTVDEGALWLLGTDHLVIGCECNGGATRAGTSDGYSEVQYPEDLFRCGMLLAGGTTWVYGSNGEYADVGIKVTGSENRLIGARGDVNAGPGIVVEGKYNALTNTLVLANSLGDDGGYSHVQLGAVAYGTVLDGVTEGLNFTAVSARPKCVVDDQVDIFGMPNLAELLPIIRNVVHEQQYKYRKINQKNVSRALQPTSSGNPILRPPSRYCSGQTFYDTKGNRLTISDGTYWRDANGAIVGNVVPPGVALLSDPTGDLGWVAGNGTGGLAGVSGWSKFNTARAMEITADGSGDSCVAQTASVISNIKAGASYSLLAHHLGETRLASLTFSLAWYDKQSNQIGAAVTTASDAQTAQETAQRYPTVSVVAPDGAVAAGLTATFTSTGMHQGDAFQITKFCLVPGGDPGNFVDP